jgi:pimeloyl-ACP methyl ester carboxylesterase
MVLKAMAHWIFLRGLARESRHWGRFVDDFAQAHPDARVVTLDLPGNGLRYHEPSPASVAGMVEAYRAQLAVLGLHAPYRLLAVSMGAMVAAEWSHRYPDEVARQVLINTSMRPFSAFYKRLRPHNYGTLLRLIAMQITASQWERAVLQLTTHRAHPEVLPYWQALREQFPVSRTNALRQLWAAARYCANGHRPAALTLVLVSAQDALVCATCSHALAAAWGASVAVHPTAGHDLTLDDGPWVATRVAEWSRNANDFPLSRY